MNAPAVQSPAAAEADALGQDAFRAAMRYLVGGVSIVTMGAGADRRGLTATSVTSLSAEPPSLIVCIKQSASGIPVLRSHGLFAVSILGHGHQEIADRFSGRAGLQGEDRFADAPWEGRPGFPPILADALASFECEVEDMIDRFSHTIVVGRVTESRALGGDGALVYWRAAYGRVE